MLIKQKLIIVFLLTFLAVPVESVQALGIASGTFLPNIATLTYRIGGGPAQTKLAAVTVVVDNKVKPTVGKNGDASVLPGSTDQALLFSLRNDGNTTQRYALTATNGSGLVMDNVRIYLDSGSVPGAYDSTDRLYEDPATFGDVAANGTLALLVVADTPAAATSGQTSTYNLLATTVDGGTTTVAGQAAGQNTDGVDVVFADLAGTDPADTLRNGQHSAAATYTVAGALELAIFKSQVITADPKHGTTNPRALPGATVAYTLVVSVTGLGTATNVVVTDPMPANATYKAGTLKLNGVALTDAAGDDAGNVGGVPVVVTVSLGNLTSASALQTITFDVLIDEN